MFSVLKIFANWQPSESDVQSWNNQKILAVVLTARYNPDSKKSQKPPAKL
jgi:hypothetical protein